MMVDAGKLLISPFQGSCSNVTSKCVCAPGYGGLMCELDINECASNEPICGPHACINLPGDYRCDCDFFRSGKRCQTSQFVVGEKIGEALFISLVSGIGLFVVIISSIVLLLIVAFLVLCAIRTSLAYRLSKRISRFVQHEDETNASFFD